MAKKSNGRLSSPQELETLRASIIKARDASQSCITVCGGTGCLALGAEGVIAGFRRELKERRLESQISLRVTGCPGFCERGPLVVIKPENILYQQVKAEDVAEIVSATVKGKVVDRLLYVDPDTGKKITYESDVPFYKKQKRLLLGNNSNIDPTIIEDYLAIGGYAALSKALFDMTPGGVIAEVKKAGLRGRGGGGFPAGVKWESCRKASGEKHYVICNCDEGDPGAFMDRSLMEGNPHSVLEGMVIGAYAIGGHEGYIYVRNEYPLAVKNARIAIEQAEKLGLLGKDILGSGFDFTVKISRGGGAFICGESTALMASLEGKVGEPRAKYVHSVEKGLWGQPTTLNNVETWANVPLIIKNGADWYSAIGSKDNKGTKIFSLVGKINNTGLIEVPMGITLREIIYDIGGGIPNGKKFKTVQTGGPSGGCIPESLLDLPAEQRRLLDLPEEMESLLELPVEQRRSLGLTEEQESLLVVLHVDFDKLTTINSMMGSGGMIVMDEDTCMVDIAKYFINFLEGESCGKCLPCREGLKRMSQILSDITEGKGKESDIELLERLSATLRDTSLCALGSTAVNPVWTTIQYFRDEYEAHIKDKRCPAGVCKALVTYSIDEEKCPGCGLCVKACPSEAITDMGKKKPVVLDQEKCIKCGACYDVCKLGAVIRK